MKKLFLGMALVMGVGLLQAQVNISGNVTDAETGEALFGATVILEGQTGGTVTDLDGNFVLEGVNGGDYNLVISFAGYSELTKAIQVGTSNLDLGALELSFDAVGLAEIEVIASFATDRRTPVAVSTISGEKVEALVGNQEFPEIMRKTPGVYVTKQGGGFGDSRINIRGFDQRNTAVMINGIPVNDMENGWVYWSNWAGLADVTSSIQVQRGLGASKLAVASVGGSINIVTNAAEMREGGAVSVSVGNDGFQKYSFALSTGLSDNGWAFSMLASHTRGDGYANGTMFRAYNYFGSITKEFNSKHTLAFTALGAPQWHHQRFEPGVFDGVNLRTFVDPDDPNNADPTTGRGIKFNWLYGTLNGEEFSWRRNFYHKPKAFINHYWNITPKVNLKTSAYVSLGRGGGTGPRGRLRTPGSLFDTDFRLRDANGLFRFDDLVRYNQGLAVEDWGGAKADRNGSYLVTSDGRFYDGTNPREAGSGLVRRASMNLHNWYGVLSTLNADLSPNWNLVAGIDARYYIGEHFRRLENLLGADGYVSRSDINNPANLITETAPAEFGSFSDNSYKDGNNVLAYWNDGVVNWLGLFAQLEYNRDNLSAFLSLSGSNQGFKRIDYFIYKPYEQQKESEWQNFLGGTIKLGMNYNLDDNNNIFVNGGYFSRQPIFDNVFINFRNDVNPDVQNQTVQAFEAGYGYKSRGFNLKTNVYYTNWGNRQFDRSIRNADGEDVLYQFQNVGQTHIGLELEADARFGDLDLFAMASIGNWEYSSDFTATGVNLDTNEPEGSLTIYGDGLKVGDAAQTTFALGGGYRIADGLRVYADYFFAGNLYANYNIQDATFQDPNRNQVAKLPTYGLVDAGLSYNFEVGGLDVTWRLNINNVLDEIYVSEMNTSIVDDPSTPRNEFYDNLGIFGFGRTWNTGLKFKF